MVRIKCGKNTEQELFRAAISRKKLRCDLVRDQRANHDREGRVQHQFYGVELGGQGDHEALLAREGGRRDARRCERLKVLVFAQVQVTVLQSGRFERETGGNALENS